MDFAGQLPRRAILAKELGCGMKAFMHK